LGVLGIPLKRPKRGLFGALWRESEGVRRRVSKGLRSGRRKKEGFGGRKGFLALPKELKEGVWGSEELEEAIEGKKKGWKREGKGLRGKIFRESFGKPLDRQIRQGPPSQKATGVGLN